MNRYILFLLTALALLQVGCASTRDMATLTYNTRAEGDFLDNDGAENYNFYIYDGWGERPVAYLALDKKYTFESQFWYPTRMSPTLWREIYRSTTFLQEDDYRARAILSSRSEIIGYMLTRHYQVFAWLSEPHSTIVVVPPPEMSPVQADRLRWRLDFD